MGRFLVGVSPSVVAVSTAVPSAGAPEKVFENGYYGANVQLGVSAHVAFNFFDHAVADRLAFVCGLTATTPAGWEANALAVVSIATRIHITPSGEVCTSGPVNATGDIGSDGETAPSEPTTITLSEHIVAGTHCTGKALAASGTVHASICPAGMRAPSRLA